MRVVTTPQKSRKKLSGTIFDEITDSNDKSQSMNQKLQGEDTSEEEEEEDDI